MSKGHISRAGYLTHLLTQGLRTVGGKLFSGVWDLERLSWVARVPVLPERLRRHHRSHVWPPGREAPDDLKTVAGIWRDPEAEEEAFEERPLHAFFSVHAEAAQDMLDHGWEYLLPTAPRYLRAIARIRGVRRSNKTIDSRGIRPAPRTPAQRSARIREEAARVGLGAIGFAPYDPKYSWQEYAPRHERGTVIVCIFEQDWENTQTAPSARAERAAFFAYAELMQRTAAVSEVIQQELGGKAQPHGPVGEAIVIHYGVRAGLGQLGINGQLLTPAAGSRARIALITTNLEFEHDEPKDFGVNAICDECQVCVRRCPVGAIPAKRAEHRGVVKAKIKTERCFPVVARVEGCAICMKTCPVQRYGLDAVIDRYERTGEILGKGSDELEGFTWPLDGHFYGPGEKPSVPEQSLVNPPDWEFDPLRVYPAGLAEEGEPPPTH